MDGAAERRRKKHICVGLIAHVDAGKTTLSEAMLYLSGKIKKLGRVFLKARQNITRRQNLGQNSARFLLLAATCL